MHTVPDWTLRIANDGADDLKVILEPWGSEYVIESGGSRVVVEKGGKRDQQVEIRALPGQVRIFARTGALMSITKDGVELS